MDKELYINNSGYMDPTAAVAIDNADNIARRKKLLKAIFCMCEASGFYLEERIVLRDLKTGKVWR